MEVLPLPISGCPKLELVSLTGNDIIKDLNAFTPTLQEGGEDNPITSQLRSLDVQGLRGPKIEEDPEVLAGLLSNTHLQLEYKNEWLQLGVYSQFPVLM
jgi:hypothetical protein